MHSQLSWTVKQNALLAVLDFSHSLFFSSTQCIRGTKHQKELGEAACAIQLPNLLWKIQDWSPPRLASKNSWCSFSCASHSFINFLRRDFVNSKLSWSWVGNPWRMNGNWMIRNSTHKPKSPRVKMPLFWKALWGTSCPFPISACASPALSTHSLF